MRQLGTALFLICTSVLTANSLFATNNVRQITGAGEDQIVHYSSPVLTSDLLHADILAKLEQKLHYPAPIDSSNVLSFINLAKQIWPIIENNRPVAKVHTDYANALPHDITSALDMENFSDLQIDTRRYYATNIYGMTVYDIVISAVHQYGGTFNGKGAFLETVSLLPSQVDVIWGYTVNLGAKHIKTTNAGSKDQPVARMILDLTFSVETVFKTHRTTDVFEFRGDRARARVVN